MELGPVGANGRLRQHPDRQQHGQGGAALTLVWRFPAREAEPRAADFYFGNSVGGAGAASEQWGMKSRA
jgi:hypothetical protein